MVPTNNNGINCNKNSRQTYQKDLSKGKEGSGDQQLEQQRLPAVDRIQVDGTSASGILATVLRSGSRTCCKYWSLELESGP